ncbi:chemotaxis protein CheW [Desulfonema ishimotonii]|uniref:Chemotaxis protein CheW n=1 Tax=Desulfonema ishimotonii TaxID=45657 RepID=A0A401FVK6_9BACT|nr:chemotaxis protein CheW [Desulfonema ishimotonii]
MKKELSKQEETRRLREKMERWEKYIIFTLADEEYCINILKICEVIMAKPFTRIPHAPHFIKGVINLRGSIIPIMDFRLRLGMKDISYTDRTCFIIVNAGKMVTGIAVDSVAGVLNIRGKDIEDAPLPDGNVKPDYILGMAKSEEEEKVRIIVNVDGMLSLKEKDVLKYHLNENEAGLSANS